jgi:hypothetical protein
VARRYHIPIPKETDLPISYNIAPSQKGRPAMGMPVILAEVHHEAWLSNQAGKEVLVPFPADAMRAWPISPRVNSPKNNDPDLIRPF